MGLTVTLHSLAAQANKNSTSRAAQAGAESNAARRASAAPDIPTQLSELQKSVASLSAEVNALKKKNEALEAKATKLQDSETKTAFRVTVIEPAVNKLFQDCNRLFEDFKNHTHSFDVGIASGASIRWGDKAALAGYYFVISSPNQHLGSNLSKPIVPNK
jgi:predicted RNase H-like nuclease (RuvC/YqgF family)